MPSDERRDVEEEQILDFSQHAGLNGSADGHHFVGIHAAMQLLAEQILDDLLDTRDACRATDEHDLVDLGWIGTGIQRRLRGPDRLLEQILDELLELCAESASSACASDRSGRR